MSQYTAFKKTCLRLKEDFVRAFSDHKAEWTDFKVVQVGGEYYRAKRSDLARYGLEDRP